MNKIKVELIGGLGNQLFQHAAAKKLQKKFSNYKIIYYNYKTKWSDQSVNIDFFLEIKKNKKIFNYYLNKYQRLKDFLFGYVINDLRGGKGCEEKDKFNFENIPKKKNFILRGFFQNIIWYNDVLDEVCNEIVSCSKEKIFDSFEESELVVQFRRSDYIKYGWEINIDYYFKALAILNKNKAKKITIVSEDIQFNDLLYNKLQSEGYKILPMKVNKNFLKSVSDFTTLIKSKNLILANSSFGWWAASIRSKMGYDDKTVILPKLWFPKFKNFHPGNPHDWLEINNSFI
jgi:hypothetical protein